MLRFLLESPRRLSFAARAEALEEIMRFGAEESLAEARAMVSGPLLRVRTGRLRESFFLRGESDGGSVRVALGNTAPYAILHEEGWGSRPARPFLRPALEARQEKIAALLARAFGEKNA